MNEHRNETAKWLQYLMYVGVAALVNTILGSFGLGGLTSWISLAVTVATVCLLLALGRSNPRYRTAAIFSALPLISRFFSNPVVVLAVIACGLIAQYQEYHAHGELVEALDSKLSEQWNGLFAMQFCVSIATALLTGLLTVIFTMTETVITTITTLIVMALDVLYLVYLKRTIQTLKQEVVVE